MGFEINKDLTNRLKNITQLDTTVIVYVNDEVSYQISTLPSNKYMPKIFQLHIPNYEPLLAKLVKMVCTFQLMDTCNVKSISKYSLPSFKRSIVLLTTISCASKRSQNLNSELGEESKIAEVVDNFIEEITFDKPNYEFFKDSNIGRFKEKLSDQLCVLADGPCAYSGDTRWQVHTGMNISESEFNYGVDLYIIAMEKAAVAHKLQNSLLKEMA